MNDVCVEARLCNVYTILEKIKRYLTITFGRLWNVVERYTGTNAERIFFVANKTAATD